MRKRCSGIEREKNSLSKRDVRPFLNSEGSAGRFGRGEGGGRRRRPLPLGGKKKRRRYDILID